MSRLAFVGVDANPAEVYAAVSDITRLGEWSPECTGGEWTQGAPGTIGSRFTGHNRSGDRTWSTDCQIVAAEPNRRFSWSVLSSSPDADNSVWSFEVAPKDGGTRLTQRYVLRELTDGLSAFRDKQPPEEADRFLEERKASLRDAMENTLAGIKLATEQH